jgi:hypothetical protein
MSSKLGILKMVYTDEELFFMGVDRGVKNSTFVTLMDVRLDAMWPSVTKDFLVRQRNMIAALGKKKPYSQDDHLRHHQSYSSWKQRWKKNSKRR